MVETTARVCPQCGGTDFTGRRSDAVYCKQLCQWRAKDRSTHAVNVHGYGGYTRGCKCEVCMQAKRDYGKVQRARAAS